MPADLYHADLKSITGADLYQSILDFTGVDRPTDERPKEGYLLDFKKEIGDSSIQTIAALANTFGGLVFLGVDDDHGRPNRLVGIPYPGELKTHLANLIGSNLVPCPTFEIAECALPKDGSRKLAVVRVRETQEVCLVTKKGEKHPVYVRVEDKSEPADASALRALLERKRQVQNAVEELQARVARLRSRLVMTWQDSTGGIVRSDTFLRPLICPTAHPLLPLDLIVERRFSELVLTPGIASLITNGDAKHELQRSRDWFEIRLSEPSLKYERRWLLTDHADVGFITQTKWPMPGTKGEWSLYDLAADLIAVTKMAKEFWRSTDYYGRFRIEAELQVRDLRLSVASSGFQPLYYGQLGHIGRLQRKVLAIVDHPQPAGDASGDFSYQDLNLQLDEVVAGVLNQLLRSLGHGTEIEKLKGVVRSIK
jgi:hypothetical protein